MLSHISVVGSRHGQGQPGGVRTFFEIYVGPLGLTHARVARGIFYPWTPLI